MIHYHVCGEIFSYSFRWKILIFNLPYEYVEKYASVLHYYFCRYGLIIPNRAAKSKTVVSRVSVFANDEDDDQVYKDTSADWIYYSM